MGCKLYVFVASIFMLKNPGLPEEMTDSGTSHAFMKLNLFREQTGLWLVLQEHDEHPQISVNKIDTYAGGA